MLIFEIPWSKLCDKNSNCTFLWIFSLLWRHVCVEPSLFTQTFQKPKKYFVKNLLSHFEKRPKRRDSYQVLSFSATFLKQTLTSYNCTVPQKWKNRAILLKVDCHQCQGEIWCYFLLIWWQYRCDLLKGRQPNFVIRRFESGKLLTFLNHKFSYQYNSHSSGIRFSASDLNNHFLFPHWNPCKLPVVFTFLN